MWEPDIVADIHPEPATEVAVIAEMIADESMVELADMSKVVDMAFIGGICSYIPSQPHWLLVPLMPAISAILQVQWLPSDFQYCRALEL